VVTPDSVLDRIVSDVRRRLVTTTEAPGLEAAAYMAVEARRRNGVRSLERALSGPGPAVIAECKKASPSAGVIRTDFDAKELATAYAAGGAAAISVVTEPDSFGGDVRWLGEVRKTVDLPVLRKDFIIDRRQLYETAVLGADAVLLIARILDRETLAGLLRTAHELELEVLLEIFADEDPAAAVASGASIIGVNARDLATFEVRIDRLLSLAAELPSDRVRVAESGIRSRADLERLRAAGFDAFLVGEHLVRAPDPEAAVRQLLGHGRGNGDGHGC
jgi:indole-3-glycerol phosphate synthase